MINNINNTNTIAPEDDEPQLGILFLLFKIFYGKKMKCVHISIIFIARKAFFCYDFYEQEEL